MAETLMTTAIGSQSQARAVLSQPDVLSTSIAPGLYYATNATNVPTNSTSGYLDVTVRGDNQTTIRTIKWRPYNGYDEFINILPSSSTWSGWRQVSEYLLQKALILSSTNVISDTYILGLSDGVYQVASSTSISAYLPSSYGTLIVNKSGNSYGVFTFVGTGGRIWIRSAANGTTWHTEWNELITASSISIPNNSDFDNYISSGVYYVGTDAAAATMSNIPKNEAGILYVTVFGSSPMSGNWANTVQIYVTLKTGYIFKRRVSTNGSGVVSAEAWLQFSQTNDFDTAVDLSSYTSESPYTCPSDGYLTVTSGKALNDYMVGTIRGSSASTTIQLSAKTQVANYQEYNTVMVRKGMRIHKLSSTGTESAIKFVPFK